MGRAGEKRGPGRGSTGRKVSSGVLGRRTDRHTAADELITDLRGQPAGCRAGRFRDWPASRPALPASDTEKRAAGAVAEQAQPVIDQVSAVTGTSRFLVNDFRDD